ncbi:hypothetical protein GDO81_021709 [Engystomops pustulosus]|uniref:Uncharacterized protein n=1 Tax=Engystomops pustulosus TaxID=76066 RepID=A0AAV6ZP70_ENGPU|nr:hypothetical protein GDO81_021709 [Engystomops pustulosus]
MVKENERSGSFHQAREYGNLAQICVENSETTYLVRRLQGVYLSLGVRIGVLNKCTDLIKNFRFEIIKTYLLGCRRGHVFSST